MIGTGVATGAVVMLCHEAAGDSRFLVDRSTLKGMVEARASAKPETCLIWYSTTSPLTIVVCHCGLRQHVNSKSCNITEIFMR